VGLSARGHIRTIQKSNEIVAAKMIVYSGDDEEYYTFISKEAYMALFEWMIYKSLLEN
jgi:hypothetical protein